MQSAVNHENVHDDKNIQKNDKFLVCVDFWIANSVTNESIKWDYPKSLAWDPL